MCLHWTGTSPGSWSLWDGETLKGLVELSRGLRASLLILPEGEVTLVAREARLTLSDAGPVIRLSVETSAAAGRISHHPWPKVRLGKWTERLDYLFWMTEGIEGSSLLR